MGKHKVTNGQINKAFTRGVICWLNGNPLNWVKYAIYYGKYVIKLRETKVANLAWQVESGGVHEGKWTLCPTTSRQSKIEFEIIDAKGLKSKGAQFLNKGHMMSKLSWFQLSPNWHLKEIQSCEKMMQVEKLVLGNVKKTINIDVIENEEVIVAEKRCKITLEDSQNVHVVTIQQLVMVEKQLETAMQSTIPFSM